ncbi:hypothetical protein ACQUZK_08830, partial [Streptococcus pyogenes]|uniref:hypothetical protein n=1 Tax=Streptococcus pyogenes TaxID=1314 RepID=UPI003DA0CA89
MNDPTLAHSPPTESPRARPRDRAGAKVAQRPGPRMLAVAATVLIASCASSPRQMETAQQDPQAPTLTATPVLTKLSNPWDMAFLPDGTM